LITAVRSAAATRIRRNTAISINGAATSQNGIQPNNGSCPRSGGKSRHATAPPASQIQSRFSMACVRMAGFDMLDMGHLHRCDARILAGRGLTH